MFERFTDRARRVVVLAQEEARELGHNYIGTEHLLLGLLREDDGVAARALAAMGIGLDVVRLEVRQIIGPGEGQEAGHIPFTPRAKKALELSTKEAQGLGHNYVGCEHLLLGVLAAENGLGGQVLQRLGVELRTTRRAVVSALAGFVHSGAQEDAPQASVTSTLDEILARLEAIERRLAG